MSESSSTRLVSSIITLRLDYYNATVAGVANKQNACLQEIQNNAGMARHKKSQHNHITLLFKELHWLLVKYYIQHKLTALIFLHFDGTLLAISVLFPHHLPTIMLPFRSSTE